MTSFTHLHCHSTYSFLDGYGTPEQIANRLIELGHSACAITDHGNTFAHVPYQRAFRQHNLRPIFGCEFYIVDDMRSRERYVKTIGADAWPHVTVLAYNQIGYQNLLRLSRLSYEDGFYYKPRIDWLELARYQEGLVVLSGCVGGFPARLITTKGAEASWEFIKQRVAQIEHYYVELIPEPGLTESIDTFDVLVTIAKDLQIPMVMTSDAHFPRASDHQIQDLMLSVGIHKKVNDPTRTLRLPEYQYYCSETELFARARQVSATATDAELLLALDNAGKIADACYVELPHAPAVQYPGAPKTEDAELLLWKLVAKGLRERTIPQEDWQTYYRRAAHEYDVIRRKGFCSYLLIINDVVHHVRSLGSLTICRGSAGGCLLLWLLGASETDPIRHRLSFERFYDDTRSDPPDVDIDFEKAFREAAITYVYEKYGKENCSRLAALSRVRIKQAVQDTAFALGIPRSEFSSLSSSLEAMDTDEEGHIKFNNELAKSVNEKHPDLLNFALKMVGQYRQQSINAAGVLISSAPLTDVIGVVLDQQKRPVAAVDKYGAQDLGFLKMDFLSVNSLDIVAGAVRRLGKEMSWLYNLPLDDERAYQVAKAGLLAGIFQLDGSSAARVSRQISLDTFEDLYAASALCRPGPGDWVSTYSNNKKSASVFEQYLQKLHPIAADVVKYTYGILIYQEQVMRLARELANFDWPDVHKLRKGIVASSGDEFFEKYHQMFTDGCLKNGVTPHEAEHWWNSILSHGGYSFNGAHSVTYGLVSYWMLYLKAHYPSAFYESYLSLEDNETTIKKLLREFMALGGKVEVLNPVYISLTFSLPKPGFLVGGLQNIKGIGEVTARKIMQSGPFHNWGEFINVLPNAMKQKFINAGIHLGLENVDTQALLQLAPWAPILKTGQEESDLKKSRGFSSPGDLQIGDDIGGDIVLCGYITVNESEQEKVKFVIEDETGTIFCRVLQRMVSSVGHKFKALQVSDYVVAVGWWSGEIFYAKDVAVAKRKETEVVRPNKSRSTRSRVKDEGSAVS